MVAIVVDEVFCTNVLYSGVHELVMNDTVSSAALAPVHFQLTAANTSFLFCWFALVCSTYRNNLCHWMCPMCSARSNVGFQHYLQR